MATEQEKLDYTEPIEISDGIYWLGFYDENAAFHSNPYLIKDGDEVVIIDPAGITEYPQVASKIFSIIKPSQVSHIILHHQDPDLCAAVPMLENAIGNKDLKLVTHSRASVLIHYYGVKSEFYLVDNNDYSLTLKSGRRLKFMTTPFMHFPAAIVTYDETSKILFSSDIFGAISKDWNLYASEGYQEKMATFHKGYMPSNKFLNAFVEKIEPLDIEMILPQHGSVIKGDMVPKCMDFLKTLKVGLDLASTDEELYGWIPKA
jgi:flavorubredoxin